MWFVRSSKTSHTAEVMRMSVFDFSIWSGTIVQRFGLRTTVPSRGTRVFQSQSSIDSRTFFRKVSSETARSTTFVFILFDLAVLSLTLWLFVSWHLVGLCFARFVFPSPDVRDPVI